MQSLLRFKAGDFRAALLAGLMSLTGPTSLLISSALLGLSSSAALAEDNVIVVTADQARIVKIPQGAKTLVIGNPIIADVTLQNGVMIVTGKGFGETNFIALDGLGNPVAESTIRVVAARNVLVVQRGMDRQSYTCAPDCEATVRLGDDPKFFGDTAGQFQTRAAQAGGK